MGQHCPKETCRAWEGVVTGTPGMLGVVIGAPGLNRAQWPCQMTSYPEVTAPHHMARPQPADPPHPSPLGLLAQRGLLPSSASCR